MRADVITQHEIGLARVDDAQQIACLSRDCIEQGLGWKWRPQRVLRCIASSTINVAVCREVPGLAGFAIMQYGEQEAHLLLLAVDPARRRRGIATALMAWMEKTARTAGMEAIRLELRAANSAALAFYASLGYRECERVPGMYNGIEDGARYAKDLWESAG